MSCLESKLSDFRGYPNKEFTYTRTQSFQKNNCSGSLIGSYVEYSKSYTSYLNIDHASQLAYEDSNFEIEGQANANNSGTCSASAKIVYLNTNIANNKLLKDVSYMAYHFYDSNDNLLDSVIMPIKRGDSEYIAAEINPAATKISITVEARRYNWFHDTDCLFRANTNPYTGPENTLYHTKFKAGINTWEIATSPIFDMTNNIYFAIIIYAYVNQI